MDKNFTAQIHVHYDNKCNFLNKKVSSKMIFLVLVNNRAQRFIELKKNTISQNFLKLSNRNPRNQPNFHDAKMHVIYRILEHYHTFHFFNNPSSIECFVFQTV